MEYRNKDTLSFLKLSSLLLLAGQVVISGTVEALTRALGHGGAGQSGTMGAHGGVAGRAGINRTADILGGVCACD